MVSQARVLQFVVPNARRWPRLQIDVPVRVIAQKLNNPVVVQGRGKDLNEGGLAIFAGVELQVGDHIAVEFTPPYSDMPIRVRCVVRNRRAYVYGVEFLLEDSQDLARVNQIRTVLVALHPAKPEK